MARRRRGIGFPQRAHALVALLACHDSEQYLTAWEAMPWRRRGIGFPQRAHALVALLAGGSQASFFDGVFMAYRCTAFLRGRVWCALDSAHNLNEAQKRC